MQLNSGGGFLQSFLTTLVRGIVRALLNRLLPQSRRSNYGSSTGTGGYFQRRRTAKRKRNNQIDDLIESFTEDKKES